MKVEQLLPVVGNQSEFSFRFHKFIPHESGCYVLCTFEKEILYIGLTDNLNRRFSEHRDNRVKRGQTEHGAAFWFYYLLCKKKDLNRIERTWLNQYFDLDGRRPVLNKIDSPLI